MDERRRMRIGVFGGVQRALASDVALAARVAGALAALVSAGAVVGLALAAVGAPERSVAGWGGVAAGVLLGTLLAGIALLNRRRTGEAGRNRARVFAALGVLGVGAIGGALAVSRLERPVAGIIGVIATGAAVALGVRCLQVVEGAVLRAAEAGRRSWHAQIRASRLTRRMIGYAAYRQLRRDGALPVKSTVFPGRTYLVPIRTTPSGARILVLEGDRPIGGLCLRPRQPLPDPEEALTHILAIRTDERGWLGRANFFPRDRALTPQALGLAPGRPGNYDR